MIVNTGWIPRDDRTLEQKLITKEFEAETPTFSEINRGVDLPKQALLYELEVKATGKLMPRYYQLSGSCVGYSAARAYDLAQCGDVVHRGDREEIKPIHPLPTYGVGRKMAGMRRKGEGSFGAAQAKAIAEFGMLPVGDPRLPAMQLVDGWLRVNSSSTEIAWSYSPQWPVSESELAQDANKYVIQTVTRVRKREELKQGLAQGYSGTMAGMFGSNNMRVQSGVLIAPWSTTWAHQQTISGYIEHETLGDIFAIDNQWFKNAHPKCPLLSSLGVYGSYFVLGSTMDQILNSNDSEVFLHSNTAGFPVRQFNWGDLRIGY